MRKFVLTMILFSLFLSPLFIEVILPSTFFCYRPSEALRFKHDKLCAPFYPNQTVEMTSVGDLCYYTEYAIEKNEIWVTDELGYRNDKRIENPDVLLIGDSFIVGSGLTQSSTLSNTLIEKFENTLTAYNIAQANFSDFIDLRNMNEIGIPKYIIYAAVERNIPPAITDKKNKIELQNDKLVTIWKDRLTRMYSINYLRARINKKHGTGIKSPVEPRMHFLNGVNQEYHDVEINEIAHTILTYKNYCDSLGISFIFMPIPNKETVYFDLVPFNEQPTFIFNLTSHLNSMGVSTINALEVFNQWRDSNSTFLYHFDDTHWNSNGVNLVADAIVREIE